MFLLCDFSRVLFIRAARVRAFFVICLLPGNIFGFTLCNISSNYAIPPATLYYGELRNAKHCMLQESLLRALAFR